MRQQDQDQGPSEREILADITDFGLHIVHRPGSPAAPAYSCTAGLYDSFGQPEVIVFGLPQDVAEELLQAIADGCEGGATYVAGTKHEGLLQGYPVRFLEVPAAARGDWFAAAQWAYEGAEFPAVQLVWPDPQGRWPWDPTARQGFRTSQRLLGLPPGAAEAKP
jgi:hypothetical protein